MNDQVRIDRGPSVTITKVTPELAEQWLGKNTHNRNIRQPIVNAYARDMTNGHWHLTAEPIKFSADGLLLDGQHRLLAITQSGVSVDMIVAEGILADAQRVMDTGIKRRADDGLKLDGFSHASTLAAAARFALICSLTGKPWSNLVPTNSEIREFIAGNPEFQAAVVSAASYRKTIDIMPSVISVGWWRLVQINSEECEDFFTSIANSATKGAGDPRSALIHRLHTARRNAERLSQGAQLSLLFRTWNAWRKGQPMQKISVYGKDGSWIIAPEPV